MRSTFNVQRSTFNVGSIGRPPLDTSIANTPVHNCLHYSTVVLYCTQTSHTGRTGSTRDLETLIKEKSLTWNVRQAIPRSSPSTAPLPRGKSPSLGDPDILGIHQPHCTTLSRDSGTGQAVQTARRRAAYVSISPYSG